MADPGTTELSANCAKLVAGSRVTLHGLTSRAGIGLNGLTGTTLGSANSAGRVPVRVTVQGSTATRGVVEEKLIREDNLQMAQDEQPMMVIIGSHKYVVSGRVLSKHEDTFFAAALRQQAHLGDASSGELRISRANGQLYEHVFRFLNCWPAGELPLISHEVSAEMASALLDEADFLLLPAMAWLFSAHVVNAACLEREDLYNRQAEDAMRWLFARQRDAPELNNRHLGLVDLKAAARSAGRSTYPVCFSHISPAVDTSKLVGSSYEALESFREYYPGVIDALSACATDSACSWFVAGGSVVRCLLRDPRAGPFFASGDVDVFICAKGDAAENHATRVLSCPAAFAASWSRSVMPFGSRGPSSQSTSGVDGRSNGRDTGALTRFGRISTCRSSCASTKARRKFSVALMSIAAALALGQKAATPPSLLACTT